MNEDTEGSSVTEELQSRLVKRSADLESAVCRDIQYYKEKFLTDIEV